ncbi:MAG: NlpC/P60 family protein [Candidatus Acidiferrales bacterium]
MASAAFAAVCQTYKMMGRFIFAALWLATASTALGQNAHPASAETHGPRPIARTEGRKILAAIPKVDVGSESETDCSHLVHDTYEQAGFPYEYVSSRELYIGSTNFTRVRVPQAGDLVVWRGHVGIVIDPQQHSFFSFVSSGPDTQFYDSPYWRSRGIARFFRYVTDRPLHADRTLEAADHRDRKPVQVHGDNLSSENHPPSELSRPVPAPALHPVPASDVSSSITVEAPGKIVLQVAGKNPSPEEIVAAFVEMNQDFGESLRTGSLNSPGKSIVVYRELRVLAVQIKGKRGTALLQVESLAAAADTQTGSQLRWREESLEFEKTKRGWVMTPLKDAAYVNREVALRVLSARLADLAKNTYATPEQEREQTQIIRFLNLLVIDNSAIASAQSN